MSTRVEQTGYASAGLNVTSAVTLADFGFTPTQLSDADSMHFAVVSGNTCYYTYDGSVPTISPILGLPVPVAGERIVSGNRAIKNFKIISSSGSSRVFVQLNKY